MSSFDWDIPFVNTSGEEVPAYACMKVVGTTTVNGRYILEIDKPDEYGAQWQHLINGPVAVPDGGYGTCTGNFPTRIASTGSTAGELYGPRNNSWELTSNTGGFRALETGVFVREPMMVFAGKFTGTVSKGSTGTVTAYWHGTTTSQTVSSVYAVSQAFTSSDWVNVYKIANRWEAYLREC